MTTSIEEIAVLAPIPSASVSSATTVKTGLRFGCGVRSARPRSRRASAVTRRTDAFLRLLDAAEVQDAARRASAAGRHRASGRRRHVQEHQLVVQPCSARVR
jgi:hypothetical protein